MDLYIIVLCIIYHVTVIVTVMIMVMVMIIVLVIIMVIVIGFYMIDRIIGLLDDEIIGLLISREKHKGMEIGK